MDDVKKYLVLVAVFIVAWFIPVGDFRVQAAIMEALFMLQEYVREHVLFCLIPAFFIAGAIANFISQGAVIKYFGSNAPRWLSYSVASVSGTVLAVCSCTVLPLFTGIYKRGAGIGPAIAFLYSGPAINVLAIILTARVLGWQFGLARAIGAVLFAIVIGLIMAVLFKDEKSDAAMMQSGVEERRSPVQSLLFMASLVGILVFAAWGKPEGAGFAAVVYDVKWYVAGGLGIALAVMVWKWFHTDERVQWVQSSGDFALQIMPLLFIGVMVAGLLMGRPGTDAGLIPDRYITELVGGNSVIANATAAVLGSVMYFATLTEVPILQGLLGAGMGSGPALALLLAGPAVSLPNLLVIRSVIGTKKTVVFVALVVVMATISGLWFGRLM